MTHVTKRAFVAIVAAVAARLLNSSTARSESYPTMPIRVVVPYAPGGTADLVARIFAEKVSAELGQALVVDNRSGGNGVIGAAAVARAKPDGYSVLQVSTGHVILPSLQENLPYDWERDFAPVFGVSSVPEALVVNAKSNIHSIADLVASAKATPGGLNYSSGGTGSLSHLSAAFLVARLKIVSSHVPYRGLSESVEAVLSDQVQFTFGNIPDVLSLATSGRLRVLAVTADQRLPYLPEAPTMAEQGFDLVASSWTCYLVPVHTPPTIITRLHDAFATAAGDANVQMRQAKIGEMTKTLSPSGVSKFMHDEAIRWHQVIADNHITIPT